MRPVPLILGALFPGLGHVALRRYGVGVAFILLYAAALNGLVLAALWQGEAVRAALRQTSVVGVALVWALALIHLAYLAIVLARPACCARREALIQEALLAHLRGRHAEALAALERALRLCPEAADPDLDFLLGAIARRAGHARRARRHLRRSRSHDLAGKWSAEVARELAALKRGDPPPPRRRPPEARPDPLSTAGAGSRRLELARASGRMPSA